MGNCGTLEKRSAAAKRPSNPAIKEPSNQLPTSSEGKDFVDLPPSPSPLPSTQEQTMQLILTFPDSGYPDMLFNATQDSLAKDALNAAAEEWLVDSRFLEISYSGEYIPRLSRLLSKGVVVDSQLTVSLLRYIGKKLLAASSMRKKIGKLIEKGSFGSDRVLRLDTPTFADGTGCLDFEKEWIPEGILDIRFTNPSPSVTSTAPNFLWGSSVTHVDLSGLQSVTSVGDGFLSCCSSLETVNLTCLQNVSNIGSRFLFNCVSLKIVDFCSFGNVTRMGDRFLASCSSLKTISNISGLRNVKNIKGQQLGQVTNFLTGCGSLAPIDASVPGYECLSEELKKEFAKRFSEIE